MTPLVYVIMYECSIIFMNMPFYMHVSVSTCVVYVRIYVYVYVSVYIYVCVFSCIYVCVYVHVCT